MAQVEQVLLVEAGLLLGQQRSLRAGRRRLAAQLEQQWLEEAGRQRQLPSPAAGLVRRCGHPVHEVDEVAGDGDGRCEPQQRDAHP